MKIFRVSRPADDKIGWDEYDSFICVAPDEAAARCIHPSRRLSRVWNEATSQWHWLNAETGEVEVEADQYHTWTCDIERLDVEVIGDQSASHSPKRGVVLASFNAG